MDAFTKDLFADLWDDFTECEYRLIDDIDQYLADVEAAGLAEFVAVDADALNEAFASERGIEPGGMMWRLTTAGQERYRTCRALSKPASTEGGRG